MDKFKDIYDDNDYCSVRGEYIDELECMYCNFYCDKTIIENRFKKKRKKKRKHYKFDEINSEEI